MPSQLRKLALIEEGSPDTVVTFSVVQEGAAEASRQVLSIEPSDNIAVIENDRELITAKDYDITVVGLYTNATDKSQLGTWQQNQTNLKWAGIGLKDQLILQAEGPLKFQEDYEDNVSFRFNSPRTATGNYSTTTGKHTSELSYSKNGLALYKWGDADADNLADEWREFDGSFTSKTFSGGQQTLENDTNGARFGRIIYLPFEGEQITFSLDVDSVSGTYASHDIQIEFFDNTGASISASSTNISGTGRVSVTDTIPSGTAYIDCFFRSDADSGTVTTIISDPALNLGTSTEFNQFYT